MPDREKVIKHFEHLLNAAKGNYQDFVDLTVDVGEEILALLKEQEAREPHYTTLRYIVDGKEVAVQHPECPRCIENGLLLWDAEIEKGQAYCKRCGQAVKWDG